MDNRTTINSANITALVLSEESFSLIRLHFGRLKLKGLDGALKDKEIGYRLHKVLSKSDINKLTLPQFIDALLKTNKPCIFAEDINQVKGDGTDWTKAEVSLLGRIGKVVSDVTVYAANTKTPRSRDYFTENTAPKATLLFAQGALLEGCMADKKRIVDKDGKFSKEQFDTFLEDNILPSLLYASKTAGAKRALVTMPIMGGNMFAGEFKKEINQYYVEAINKLLYKHADALSNIEKLIITGLESKPQNSHPALHVTNRAIGLYPQSLFPSLRGYEVFAFIAADHVSFLGNDGYKGSPSTQEGGLGMRTNIYTKITRLNGVFHNGLYGFMREKVFTTQWEIICDERKATIDFDSILVYSKGVGTLHRFERSDAYQPQYLSALHNADYLEPEYRPPFTNFASFNLSKSILDVETTLLRLFQGTHTDEYLKNLISVKIERNGDLSIVASALDNLLKFVDLNKNFLTAPVNSDHSEYSLSTLTVSSRFTLPLIKKYTRHYDSDFTSGLKNQTLEAYVNERGKVPFIELAIYGSKVPFAQLTTYDRDNRLDILATLENILKCAYTHEVLQGTISLAIERNGYISIASSSKEDLIKIYNADISVFGGQAPNIIFDESSKLYKIYTHPYLRKGGLIAKIDNKYGEEFKSALNNQSLIALIREYSKVLFTMFAVDTDNKLDIRATLGQILRQVYTEQRLSEAPQVSIAKNGDLCISSASEGDLKAIFMADQTVTSGIAPKITHDHEKRRFYLYIPSYACEEFIDTLISAYRNEFKAALPQQSILDSLRADKPLVSFSDVALYSKECKLRVRATLTNILNMTTTPEGRLHGVEYIYFEEDGNISILANSSQDLENIRDHYLNILTSSPEPMAVSNQDNPLAPIKYKLTISFRQGMQLLDQLTADYAKDFQHALSNQTVQEHFLLIGLEELVVDQGHYFTYDDNNKPHFNEDTGLLLFPSQITSKTSPAVCGTDDIVEKSKAYPQHPIFASLRRMEEQKCAKNKLYEKLIEYVFYYIYANPWKYKDFFGTETIILLRSGHNEKFLPDNVKQQYRDIKNYHEAVRENFKIQPQKSLMSISELFNQIRRTNIEAAKNPTSFRFPETQDYYLLFASNLQEIFEKLTPQKHFLQLHA